MQTRVVLMQNDELRAGQSSVAENITLKCLGDALGVSDATVKMATGFSLEGAEGVSSITLAGWARRLRGSGLGGSGSERATGHALGGASSSAARSESL